MSYHNKEDYNKARIQEFLDEATGKKYKKAPEEFATILSRRNELIGFLRGKAKAIQIKVVFDIWNIDVELEKRIEWYVNRSADRFTQLPNVMSEWEPFANTNRFELYKDYVYQSSSRIYDNKETVDKIIRKYPIGVADLTETKYLTWEEAMEEILLQYRVVVEAESMKYYLNQDEHNNLEFKGSISLDIDELYFNGKRRDNKVLIDEGIMKAIIAFLNSRGGILIIGVLDDYEKYKEVLKDRLVVNENIIFGIEEEYTKKKWDVYLQRLTSFIEERIGSNVLDSNLVEIEKEIFEGIELCVITIQPSETRQYLYDDFYIRRNNKSILISKKKEIDQYWKNRRI